MELLLPYICICCATVGYGLACTWLDRRRRIAAVRKTDAEIVAYRDRVMRRWERGEISHQDAEDMLDQAEGRW